MELPRKLPQRNAEILKLIGFKKGAQLTNSEIFEAFPEDMRHNIARVTANMAYNGLLVSTVVNKIASYSLNDYSRAILKAIDKIHIVPYTGPRKYTRKVQKAVEPAQQPLEINISATANNVADQITALIDENAQYRKLMLNVYNTIGNALKLTESEDGDSAAT